MQKTGYAGFIRPDTLPKPTLGQDAFSNPFPNDNGVISIFSPNSAFTPLHSTPNTASASSTEMGQNHVKNALAASSGMNKAFGAVSFQHLQPQPQLSVSQQPMSQQSMSSPPSVSSSRRPFQSASLSLPSLSLSAEAFMSPINPSFSYAGSGTGHGHGHTQMHATSQPSHNIQHHGNTFNTFTSNIPPPPLNVGMPLPTPLCLTTSHGAFRNTGSMTPATSPLLLNSAISCNNVDAHRSSSQRGMGSKVSTSTSALTSLPMPVSSHSTPAVHGGGFTAFFSPMKETGKTVEEKRVEEDEFYDSNDSPLALAALHQRLHLATTTGKTNQDGSRTSSF